MSTKAGKARLRPGSHLLLIFRSDDIEGFPEHRLLFYPNIPAAPAAEPRIFAAAEALEFQEQNNPKAIGALRPLARHVDPAVRAEALARLGRNLWKSGQMAEALPPTTNWPGPDRRP